MRETIRISIGKGIHASSKDQAQARVGTRATRGPGEESYYLRPGEFFDAKISESTYAFYEQVEGRPKRHDIDVALLDRSLTGRVEIDYGDDFTHVLDGHERIPDDVKRFSVRLAKRPAQKGGRR